jgi:uncharacterized protein YndB with AHSA1/START domain
VVGPAGFTCPSLELDVRGGGRYRIAMQPPEGDAFHLGGEFREVDWPRGLIYTFAWDEPDPDDRETVVTWSFREEEGGTRLSKPMGHVAAMIVLRSVMAFGVAAGPAQSPAR